MSKLRRNCFPLTLAACILAILICIGYVFAQVAPQIQGAGAPANPCNNGGQQYVDTTNHVIYSCPSSGSNWVNIGQGQQTGATPFVTTAYSIQAALGNWSYNQPLATFVPDKAIVVTRIMSATGSPVTNCSVSPTFGINDNNVTVNLTFTNGSGGFAFLDSGPLNQPFQAGTRLAVVSAAGTCTVAPTPTNITVQYRLQ